MNLHQILSTCDWQSRLQRQTSVAAALTVGVMTVYLLVIAATLWFGWEHPEIVAALGVNSAEHLPRALSLTLFQKLCCAALLSSVTIFALRLPTRRLLDNADALTLLVIVADDATAAFTEDGMLTPPTLERLRGEAERRYGATHTDRGEARPIGAAAVFRRGGLPGLRAS